MKTGRIRPRQLSAVLIMCGIFPLLIERNTRALLTAMPAVLLCGVLMLIPTAVWAGRTEVCSPPEWAAAHLNRWVGAALAVLYGVFFLLEGVQTVAETGRLMMVTELPNALAPIMIGLICAAAGYGAWMGVESAARVSGLLAVAELVLFGILCWTQRSVWTADELSHSVWTAAEALPAGVQLAGQIGAQFVLLLVLCPWGGPFRARNTMSVWVILCMAAAAAALLTCGVLGNWADTRLYPLYTALRAAPSGVLIRPEGLYGAALAIGAYMRVLLLLVGFVMCMQSFSARWVRSSSLPVGMLIIAAGGIFLLRHMQYGVAVQTLRLSSTVLLAVGIPLVLLLSASILHRKQVHS